MGFIQPCFIESVGNDVIECLKKLGYWHCQNGYGEWYIPIERCHYIECGTSNGKAYFIGRVCKPSNGPIDCGKDKELFFAIAALRDDSEEHQVFIADSCLSVSYDDEYGNDNYFIEPKGSIFCWDNFWMNATIISGYFHKLTVKELIELI